MTGRALHEAARPQAKLLVYPGDHALDLDEARSDRRKFLLEELGLQSRETGTEPIYAA